MTKKISAGILLYRQTGDGLLVFLVHPGGPFWKYKEKGSWTIPKGEFTESEIPLHAALREFEEETGFKPDPPFIPLETIQQKAGKRVMAWAASGELEPQKLTSNTVTMEWPIHSGKKISFPEVDKGQWFTVPVALEKINRAQQALLIQLETILQSSGI